VPAKTGRHGADPTLAYEQSFYRDDLGHGIRGKHYDDYKSGTNLVLLSPDVAAMFPDEEAVNTTLRDFIKLAQKSVSLTK